MISFLKNEADQEFLAELRHCEKSLSEAIGNSSTRKSPEQKRERVCPLKQTSRTEALLWLLYRIELLTSIQAARGEPSQGIKLV